MPNRLPRARSIAVLACLAGAVPVVAATSTAAVASPTASAAATCKTPKYPGVGYYTSLKATGLGCASATKVMKHHYTCRTKHGKSGTCSRVDGYKCTEKRVKSAIEYDARVTCSKSGKKVVYTYQQDIS
ncbi:MAG: hypothetical protein JWM31_2748 [Solirubrobacterales bacterium]|nr:hypothetical protein [Solirubrobacterales bacterium]